MDTPEHIVGDDTLRRLGQQLAKVLEEAGHRQVDHLVLGHVQSLRQQGVHVVHPLHVGVGGLELRWSS